MKTIKVSTAIIKFQDGRLGFQLRDNCPTIESPGKVVFFGGQSENDEDALQALYREIKEELDLNIDVKNLKFIGTFTCPGPLHIMEQNVWVIEGIDINAVTVSEGFLCLAACGKTLEKISFPKHLQSISLKILEKAGLYNSSVNLQM